jgi:hypothetical protein
VSITGISNAVNPTDAVSYNQLTAVTDNLTNQINTIKVLIDANKVDTDKKFADTQSNLNAKIDANKA